MITTVELLLKTLNNNRELLESLFEKRNRNINLFEILNEDNQSQIQYLNEANIINIIDDTVELDEKVIDFFEEYLEANTEVNIGEIDGLLEHLQRYISLYISEDNFNIKQKNLKSIRRVLKKLPNMIFKNLKQISFHVNITYKTQSNFKNKIKQLEFYKSDLLQLLNIEKNITRILRQEVNFFDNLYDIDIVQLKLDLVLKLKELRISLISMQKEVTLYINRILDNITFWEHIIKLKELKENYEIQDKTNIKQIATTIEAVGLYKTSSTIKTQINLKILEDEQIRNKIKRIIQGKKLAKPTKIQSQKIDDIYFDKTQLTTTIIDTQGLNKEFLQTSYNLFEFLQYKNFKQEISFEQKIELFCKMLLEYEDDYIFKQNHKVFNNIKYLEVIPKDNNI
jgi:hypothetical protein